MYIYTSVFTDRRNHKTVVSYIQRVVVKQGGRNSVGSNAFLSIPFWIVLNSNSMLTFCIFFLKEEEEKPRIETK